MLDNSVIEKIDYIIDSNIRLESIDIKFIILRYFKDDMNLIRANLYYYRNLTILRYIISKKVEMAIKLSQTTDLKPKEIAKYINYDLLALNSQIRKRKINIDGKEYPMTLPRLIEKKKLAKS